MTARLLVFTDLDGTLLDRDTYEWAPARPALEALAARRVPLVLCSSKTRGELETLRRALGHEDPFIVENGGAVYVPVGRTPVAPVAAMRRDGYDVLLLGTPAPTLVTWLRQASVETGVAVRAFHQMTVDEIAQRTGLAATEAALARQRECGEPFMVQDEAADAIDRITHAIERRGGRVTAGGRFFHVTGASDKGSAARQVIALYGPGMRTVALGDAPNDLPLLAAVDLAIVVRSPHSAAVVERLPAARLTARPGPAGWNDAVLALVGAA